MWLRWWLVAAAVACWPGAARALDVEAVVSLVRLGRELASDALEAWGKVEGGVQLPFLRDPEQQLGARIADTTRRLDELGVRLQSGTRAALHAVSEQLGAALGLELRMRDLAEASAAIEDGYERLRRYVAEGYDAAAGRWRLERATLEDLASSSVSHRPDSARGLLDRLHRALVPRHDRLRRPGLLDLLASAQESASNVCNMPQSAQQLLYNLYTSVALTELKGYAMMQFSWMLLKLYDKGNFTLEAQMMRDRYEVRTEQKVAAVKAAMRAAGRELRRCDPKHHVEGETYVQLTQLLQGHVQNEVDMSTESTCRENCAYYSYAKSHGCYQNQFCSQQPRCNGRLIDCRFIDSDMWVCQADKASDRRYSWIEYENGRVLGQKGTCSRGTTKVDSWWRWLFWHCSYCFCLCDEQGPKSDRYFNLRPVAADVENNMVVTGLRFVKDNRVIHLQIQEGALLPHGEINETSLSWRPVDDYRISDSDVHNGEDYHTLSWEQRAIDIDDLMVPAGHVLTGVRFRRVGTHMNLEIMATPINFTEGILIQPKEKSLWHANDNTDASLVTPRKRIDLENPDVPTRSYASQPDSKPDQFLLFTHSDVDADAAQTTVPFLDAQPVSSNPPTLLAGAGIYHKGQRGYGGFVAPKVFTYDYAPHISAKFPSDQRYHNRRK
ncbi:uncharacterized protein LOC134537042 isoform X1 [Bacillus rossius redtenbacheri]|uniref:uncharacterized protein LOC134537042 isoform X1 n=1 Tax=Bacillus rossius redtenbacheri TaxID=93214 RepID=UPI002FDE8794